MLSERGLKPVIELLSVALAMTGVLRVLPVEGAIVTPRDPRKCLVEAVHGQTAQVKFTDEPKFQDIDVRPYNLNLPYQPFAVTYPKSTNQTAAIVHCAASYGRKVQARSGGHDYTNKGMIIQLSLSDNVHTNFLCVALGGADGAIVVDLMYLAQVQVDSLGLARVGAGNKPKDVAEKLHAANGRYMPHGSSPTVGIGGHATVGGLGLHSRLEGTTLDALQEAEVVLANGTITRTSSTQHPDLFWAIRGAGASFGIVTEFIFQTKPEPKELLNFAFTVASTDPSSLSASFKAYHQITNDIDLDRRFSAAVVVMRDRLQISGAFFGPQTDFDLINLESRIPGITERSVVAGLSWMGHMNRTFDSIASIFPAQSYFAALDTSITRSTLPTNTSIDNMFQHIQTADAGSDRWFVLIDLYGGAVGDLAADATALPHRDMAYFFTPYVITDSPTNQTTRDFIEKAVLEMQGNEPGKYLSYAGYTSLPSGFVPQEKYWGPNLGRLQQIKAVVDPDDVFSTPYGVKAVGN